MDRVVGFGKFWWDFVIGDDWMIAAVIAVVLAVLVILNRGVLWPVLPIVVITVLAVSLMRASRAT